MHAIENFLHNMCYQCSVHCKFYHVPCYCHDCHAWTVQLNNCAAVNELAIVQYFIRCSNIHKFAIAYWCHPGTIIVMMLSVWQIFIALLELKLKDSCTDTAVCVDLANQNGKALHMTIIMCRASYSGWIEAWPHNFIHVHSFFVLVLQGLRKQLYQLLHSCALCGKG